MGPRQREVGRAKARAELGLWIIEDSSPDRKILATLEPNRDSGLIFHNEYLGHRYCALAPFRQCSSVRLRR
jgi:hypothetical protein